MTCSALPIVPRRLQTDAPVLERCWQSVSVLGLSAWHVRMRFQQCLLRSAIMHRVAGAWDAGGRHVRQAVRTWLICPNNLTTSTTTCACLPCHYVQGMLLQQGAMTGRTAYTFCDQSVLMSVQVA